MVMDEYGHGQVIQQSLFERNGDWHMGRALDHLVDVNDDCLRRVRVIIVDKDLNEIRVLQSRFPEARVLICHFHVVKYLVGVAHRSDFSKISAIDFKTLETFVNNLVYSNTEVAYKDNKLALMCFCQGAGIDGYFDYFMKNWDSCVPMWVKYARADIPHLRNNTNNRLESWFGKFKNYKGKLTKDSSMADCVKDLLSNAVQCQREYIFQSRVGQNWNANFDEEMNSVLALSTHHVADEVLPQYLAAVNNFATYKFAFPEGENGQVVEVTGQKTHKVDLKDFSCTCEYATTMKLPCRHAMVYRKFKGGCSIIPLQRIDPR
jgi:hypothetical protein